MLTLARIVWELDTPRVCRILAKDLKWWAHRSPFPFYFDLTCTVRSQPTEVESIHQMHSPHQQWTHVVGGEGVGQATTLTVLVFLCSHNLGQVHL